MTCAALNTAAALAAKGGGSGAEPEPFAVRTGDGISPGGLLNRKALDPAATT